MLTPNQFPEDKVREMEIRLGSYGTAGQLQQRPAPRAGGMFKREWFAGRVVNEAPVMARRIRFWDKAGTQGGGCFTCGILIARSAEGVYYVEHEVRGQWSKHNRDRVMLETARVDRDRYGQYEPSIVVEREPGSTGKDDIVITGSLFRRAAKRCGRNRLPASVRREMCFLFAADQAASGTSMAILRSSAFSRMDSIRTGRTHPAVHSTDCFRQCDLYSTLATWC